MGTAFFFSLFSFVTPKLNHPKILVVVALKNVDLCFLRLTCKMFGWLRKRNAKKDIQIQWL